MTRDADIAVIGLSGRFPGAGTLAEFWSVLRDGVETHTELGDDELRRAGVAEELIGDPRLVRRRPILAGAALFDAGFFGYTPSEAEIIDPQQRLFLECAWEAVESAGYDPDRFDGSIGVFGGGGPSSYLMSHLCADPAYLARVGQFPALLGNEKDFIAPRTSYKLNLRGPSISVLTGCSSSLVAVHLAAQSVVNGESDMALAGGATVYFPQRAGYVHQDGGVNSPDGRCRAFDIGANGTVPGDGAGVVLLKRLDEALADGDVVHGVIRGTAVNNDGSQKVGFTAPSVQGQADVIAEALAVAEVDPRTIGYVEAHGTGTPLGDAIELTALAEAFDTSGGQFCAIGTLKPNIGHTDTAAGVLGLIKTVLMFRHSMIPPSINCATPNAKLTPDSPFHVNTGRTSWPSGSGPRRAGISSFSVGGTNAHVIVEEPPARPAASSSRAHRLIVLSARSESALQTAATNLSAGIEAVDLADAAYTLRSGRRVFDHRMAVVCDTTADAAATLNGSAAAFRGHVGRVERSVAFLFPGQGSQRAGMGQALYRDEPVFRQEVDECTEILGIDLPTILYTARADDELAQTRLTQPALFVIEYALARLLTHWGITPAAMAGHSIGEFAAACVAGVFTREDALRVVALRGKLIQDQPGGAMLAVPLSEDKARDLLTDGLAVAAVNSADQVVVSGAADEIDAFASTVDKCTRLRTSHAFHSPMMDPVVAPFTAAMAGVRLRPPRTPFLSGTTGDWITAAQATSPAYWGRQLREPVRFADMVARLRADSDRLLVEVGPGNTLRSLAAGPVIPTLGRRDDSTLLDTLAQLWVNGVTPDWNAVPAQGGRRVELPTYPFERERYLVDLPTDPQPERSETAERAHSRPDLPTAYVAPRNRVEEVIAGVWQDVLGVAVIGVHDSFFDLGGHSVLAAQLVARLRDALPVAVSVADVLSDGQTVGSLAVIVERALHDKLESMTEEMAAEQLAE
nr:type I polyketide synthase [Kibdelosporangium sp. MJ126-NF4]CEL17992.1 Malonyl CoA-acyl carrier protein transacylase [Kibdelosporangium sp. MJ126-NF4]CTQ90780.1 Malonyl CoA-acyl carrier protein transacylase (EC 2.3.1.39) [Kibdelosporangium sp. MJ126-NF4]